MRVAGPPAVNRQRELALLDILILLLELHAAEGGLDAEVAELRRQILGGGRPVGELGWRGQLELKRAVGAGPYAVATLRIAGLRQQFLALRRVVIIGVQLRNCILINP